MGLRLAERAARGIVITVLLLLPLPALAVSPILWTVETFDDFEKGRPDGVAITAPGELSLAPRLQSLKVPPMDETAEPFLWSQAQDSKGNLYVGGGHGGRVYRVPKGGAGSVYFETGELAVHALVVDHSDVLYAATSPRGRIYRITGEAKGEVYYQPEDRYIWDMVITPKGELYAATGERGIIYKVPTRGRGDVFFDSDEFHIVSLAFDTRGNLLAGSDGKGLLYRIDPAGKVSVLFDSPLREINGIAVDGAGVVYASAIGVESAQPAAMPSMPQEAAAATQQGTTVPSLQAPVPLPGADSGSSATVTVTASATGPADTAGAAARSEVYRIDPDGTATTIWFSSSETVYALAIDSSGTPMIGTGEPARVRLLTGDGQGSLLARLPESQVTSLFAGPGRQMFAATSNVGRVYLLDGAGGEGGSYLSPARDAATPARWGRISWRAGLPQGSRIEMSTRSGNSSLPDATWSDWSGVYADPDGSPITSPSARFLQWRARLSRSGGASNPSLKAVSVAYLQSNLPPLLRKVEVAPPGVVRERSAPSQEVDPADLAFTGMRVNPDGTTGTGTPAGFAEKRIYVRGMRSATWEADDPNSDTLAFDVQFKAEDETAWKPLVRGLRDSYFAFDSMQLPDGLYRLRVQASDAPSNSTTDAKSASLISDPFVVDNGPPAVQVSARRTAKGGVAIEAGATDGVGPIARAEYSLDAARWLPLPPKDGLNDSRAESYHLTLDGLRPGEHTVIIKVSDLLGNVGAGKATFTSD